MRAKATASLNHFARSVWLFPAILGVLLLVCTALQVSGSSVGVYDSLLGGRDDHLISGTPRTDRSDEWLVNTPLTISQQVHGYSMRNNSVGKGADMSITVDVPYKDWSTLFKPQNFAFFVTPFASAFAFKWWLLTYVLLVSIYLFVITLYPKRYAAGALLAVFFCFSPFIQWWYQSISLLPVAYTLLLLACAIRLIRTQQVRARLFYSAAIAYLSACFILVLYPPFQIACAMVGLGVFVAIYASSHRRPDYRDALWLVSPLLAGMAVCAVFFSLHYGVIHTEANTVYPGKRVVHSGYIQPEFLAEGPFSYLLLRGGPISVFGTNQSESAQFLFFGVLLIPYLTYRYYLVPRRKPTAIQQPVRQDRAIFIAATVVLLLFLLRMLVPAGDGLYRMIGLGTTPLNRLVIGLGIINIIYIALALFLPNRPAKLTAAFHDYVSVIMAGFAGLVIAGAGLLLHHKRLLPPDIGKLEVAAVIIAWGVIIGLLCQGDRRWRYGGVLLLVAYSLAASLSVNPLYRGFGSLQSSPVVRKISSLHHSDDHSAWVVNDKTVLEALPQTVGATSYSGVYPYPQLALWKRYFPKQEFVYNRFAHVTFRIHDDTTQRKLQLLQGDTFAVDIASCDPMLRDLNVNYIVSVNSGKSGFNCFNSRVFSYPIGSNDIAIYTRNR